jgi:hypothetical protein
MTFIVTFSYMGRKWASGLNVVDVAYRINENTSDCMGEGASVVAGADTWNNAGAAFSFSYSGAHSNTEVGYNYNNDIMWSNAVPVGVLARATSWFVANTMIEADIAFNDDYVWSCATPGPGEYDIQSTVIHEMGHWLSLRDIYGNTGDGENDIHKVMYGSGSAGETTRFLHEDDREGIIWIYGMLGQCSPPDSGDWIVSADCTMEQSATAPANVVVNENVTLTLDSGVGLQIDLSKYHLKVRNGAKVIIKPGAKIN